MPDIRILEVGVSIPGHGFIRYLGNRHPSFSNNNQNTLIVFFDFLLLVKEKEAFKLIESSLARHSMNWLVRHKGQWVLKVDILRQEIKFFSDLAWLSGDIILMPEFEIIQSEPKIKISRVDHLSVEQKRTTRVSFVVNEDYMSSLKPKKIFLSHKGSDKELVRKFSRVLKELGFDPWLDEDAMTAGTEIERGILKGFQDSCAAIFFISPAFKDERYIATEVDYAVAETRSKGTNFKIIPLVFENSDGQIGTVPSLLNRFRYVHPKSELDALFEIIRALPIEVGACEWKHP